jgi:hypothetical protein
MFFARGALTTVAGAVLVAVVAVAGVLVVVVFFVFFAVEGCARATATGENRRSSESRRIEAGKSCLSEAVMYCITADFRIVRDKMGFSK